MIVNSPAPLTIKGKYEDGGVFRKAIDIFSFILKFSENFLKVDSKKDLKVFVFLRKILYRIYLKGQT